MRFLVSIFFVLGCSQPDEIWIDETCPEQIQEAALDAVDEINSMCGEDMIHVSGVRGGLNPSDPDYDDSVPSVSCWDANPRPGVVGTTNERASVRIFYKRISSEELAEWTLKHELGHFIGGDHLSGENVMNGGFQHIIEFTSSDRKEICGE